MDRRPHLARALLAALALVVTGACGTSDDPEPVEPTSEVEENEPDEREPDENEPDENENERDENERDEA